MQNSTKETQDSLKNMFKNCLDILRDNEHLTGDKALRTIAHLLNLRLLEPHLGKTIDIDNYIYSFDKDTKMREEYRTKLLPLVRFSNLAQEKAENLPTRMKLLWEKILAVHPDTRKVYLKDRTFEITKQITYGKLIEKFNTFNFDSIENDILGEAYEEVIKDIMTGKLLGQYFTPPEVKSIMIKLIDPQLKADGTIETIFDPAMGTGGFLITSLRHIKKQADSKKIAINWDFITTKGLGGREAEPDTYQLAVSNMLISSGRMFPDLERDDSIRNPIRKKYDIVMANPPFGIKGLSFKDIPDAIRDEYVPIQSSNAVPLFLQAIIYMLNIGGRCAVVLPDGKELFGKSDELVNLRTFLMKTCDVREIIYLPGGIFNNTTIKTCILYFYKKKTGKEILTVETNRAGKNIKYNFAPEHQTSAIQFYNYDSATATKKLLVTADIDKIATKQYSLNYIDYITASDEKFANDVVVKTLEEVCEIKNGKRIVQSKSEKGDYPVLGGGGYTSFYTNIYTREGKTCKISREGMSLDNCVMILDEKYYLNSQACTINSRTDVLKDGYLWYYLNNIKEQIFNCGRGSAQRAIDMTSFKSLKIPIPPLVRQQEIVEYLDFIYDKCNKTATEHIAELKKLNEHCLRMQAMSGDNQQKTLGEVCDYEIGGTPSRSRKDYYENGTNLWISVRELNGGYVYDTTEKITDLGAEHSSVKLYKTNTVLFSFKLSIGKTAVVGKPMYSNEAIAGINSKNDKILINKYIYYYLTNTDFTKMGRGILGNGSLNKKSLGLIEMPIPSLAIQRELVDYCDKNEQLITQLEAEIEQNKKMAQQFMTTLIKENKPPSPAPTQEPVPDKQIPVDMTPPSAPDTDTQPKRKRILKKKTI